MRFLGGCCNATLPNVRVIFAKYSHCWRICLNASVEPVQGLRFFEPILRKPLVQNRKVDRIERLILAMAAEHKTRLPGFGVTQPLQTLSADTPEHALHWRVDRAQADMVRGQDVFKHVVTGCCDGRHHPVRADREQSVGLLQTNRGGSPRVQQAFAVGLHGLDDVAPKRAVLYSFRSEPRGLITAPDNGIGSGLEVGDPKAVGGASISGEIQHPATGCTHRGANGEEDCVTEPAANQNDGFAAWDCGWRTGWSHENDPFALLKLGAGVRRRPHLQNNGPD